MMRISVIKYLRRKKVKFLKCKNKSEGTKAGLSIAFDNEVSNALCPQIVRVPTRLIEIPLEPKLWPFEVDQ